MTPGTHAMEHRWSRRVPVDLEATVSRSDAESAVARARDLSPDGAFLQVDAEALRIAPGTPLVVDLVLPLGESTRRIRIPSMVVHHRREGAGVMFTARNDEIVSGIGEVLRRAMGLGDAGAGQAGALSVV